MDAKSLFSPEGVAVIGASRNPGKIGSIILKNLRITYRGRLFPVNTNASEIQSLRTYHRISDIKEQVDLAIIAIPAEGVLKVLKDCEKKKVRFAIVISAGFKESGESGTRLENEIKAFLRTSRIRVIGPNCLGVINTNPTYNATFIDPNSRPAEGKTAFISQSGALLSAIVDDATAEKIGFSKIVSIGNAIDIDEAEMLDILQRDDKTSVIALYLEGLSDGKKFIKNAQEVSKSKPIIILKGGTSKMGASAVTSHTGSLAGNNTSYELAFKRVGAIRVKNIDDLFNFMRDAPNMRVKSDEIIIVTNAGGAGVVATDALSAAGLRLAKMGNNITNELAKELPRGANINNPVDVLGDATPERYRSAIDIVAKLNKPIITLFSPQEVSMPIETAKEIYEVQLKNPGLPILPVFLGGTQVEKARRFLRDKNMPAYSYPHEAVDIIEGLYSYSTFSQPSFSVYNGVKYKAPAIRADKNLFGMAAKDLFDKMGIKTAPGVVFKTEQDMRKAASKIGYPCVLKIGSDKVVHKGEIGGVVVGIKTDEELKRAFDGVKSRAAENHVKPIDYELYKDVSRTDKTRIEILLGAHRDPQFGTMLGIGLGGEYAEILQEAFFMLVPMSDKDLADFKNSKVGRIVSTAVKRKVMDDLLGYAIKISKFMEANPKIKDLDINPLFIFDDDVVATDFKIFVE